MGKAFEISIWKPRVGKRAEFLKGMNEVAEIFKGCGVSEIQIIEGVAGKDVGNIVIIQTFKSLTDNGAVNDAVGESKAMADWMTKNSGNDSAELVSHDLYGEV